HRGRPAPPLSTQCDHVAMRHMLRRWWNNLLNRRYPIPPETAHLHAKYAEIERLMSQGDRAAIEAIIADETEPLASRYRAIQALGYPQSQVAIDLLRGHIFSDEPSLVQNGFDLLDGSYIDIEIIDRALWLLERDWNMGYETIGVALGGVGREDILTYMLHHPNPAIREAGISGMWKMHENRMLPNQTQNQLHSLIYESDAYVAGGAIVTLMKLGNELVRQEIRVIAGYDPSTSHWSPEVIDSARAAVAAYDTQQST
ncbi:MAG: hypothetical protein AAF125_12455, partial [Chloroflexota bacterium]